MACLDAGDEILVTEPFYANYIGFAMAAGIKIKAPIDMIQNPSMIPFLNPIERSKKEAGTDMIKYEI